MDKSDFYLVGSVVLLIFSFVFGTHYLPVTFLLVIMSLAERSKQREQGD